MLRRLQRTAMLALYQVVVMAGIAMLPIALLARRVGLRLPVDRMVEAAGTAYDEAAEP
jgi:hypothetical protein